jgi:VWFA-related protein
MIILTFVSIGVVWLSAQDQGQNSSEGSVIRVVVSMVQLNVAVTDEKGNYVTTLSPSDFTVAEDGIPQKMASFEEGNAAPRALLDSAQDSSQRKAPDNVAGAELPQTGIIREGDQSKSLDAIASSVGGSNVFILFDTSNYMFHGRGFVFAQDSIAEFVRSLDHPYQVAFYSYSRNFFRAASLTSDRSQVIRGVRETTNGDDSALYNALLMTLKDAGQHTGRKVVVVFSNGPDNSSMVSPEDVDELAQSEGIPI